MIRKKERTRVPAPVEDTASTEFEAFLAWNEAQLAPDANEKVDARIAQVRKDADESPHRHANALKDEAANMVWEAMEARGWTQADLARQLGKSRAYVSKLLSGGENLTLETLAQLGEVLGCQWNLALRPTRPMIVAPPTALARTENVMRSTPARLARASFRPVSLRLVTDADFLTDDTPLAMEG